MITFLKEANDMKEELIAIRRDIHEHPELGFEVFRTSQILKNFYVKKGYPFILLQKQEFVEL